VPWVFPARFLNAQPSTAETDLPAHRIEPVGMPPVAYYRCENLCNDSVVGVGCFNRSVPFAAGYTREFRRAYRAAVRQERRFLRLDRVSVSYGYRSFAKTGLGQTPGELTLKDGFSQNPFAGVACKPHCVFNLTEDESEHHDLAAARPDLLAKLLQRFAALTAEYHPPKFNPPADDAGCCAAAAANGNFLSPWTVAPPPPPPPPLVPLGSCIGAGKNAFFGAVSI
jgi:hypothetical protein